jgi:hypothetical protein
MDAPSNPTPAITRLDVFVLSCGQTAQTTMGTAIQVPGIKTWNFHICPERTKIELSEFTLL